MTLATAAQVFTPDPSMYSAWLAALLAINEWRSPAVSPGTTIFFTAAIAGAEEESRRRLGRGLTKEELERVLRRR